MKSGNSMDDSTYTSIENQLVSFTAQRDALVAQILPLLEAAELNNAPIPDSVARNLIRQATSLLSNVQAYAGSL
jgi:hypothetical protein